MNEGLRDIRQAYCSSHAEDRLNTKHSRICTRATTVLPLTSGDLLLCSFNDRLQEEQVQIYPPGDEVVRSRASPPMSSSRPPELADEPHTSGQLGRYAR